MSIKNTCHKTEWSGSTILYS